jgi:aspartyl-tRNA(Asn)/glutamyl-tRNA(Gln) amidotransferase subunit B
MKTAANYLINEIPRIAFELQVTGYRLQDRITPENFAEFVIIVSNNIISRPAAQTVLAEMFKTSVDPSHIIGEKNLAQVSDGEELSLLVETVIVSNPMVVEDYKSGKSNALQFLLGQAMKETKGKANPQTLQELFKNKLEQL